ncbi:MAG: hypothetical protein GOMPHAMPRED_002607 [Gomphillus americanus]|uniref:Adenylosuccinate synthetase n=1 Tax=Gomphillus americanus TaxID=1940652 RepID=A0A8H3FKD8_9LECA|nr:MAG: hypothetical protein GOMPHAMPRED_002607 [Gomphillus americanus]
MNPRCMNFIGSGVVFHMYVITKSPNNNGLTAVHDRILVSDRVNVLLDMHMAVDGLEEKELGGSSFGFNALFKKQQLMKTSDAAIGTTKRGNRTGIKLTDIFYPELFEEKVKRLAGGYQKRFGELFKYDIKAELACFEEYREMMRKYVVDGVSFMTSAQQSDMKIVVEGANALMLDIDYGSYPFVTSSSTTLAGIIGGLTLNPKNITETIGVVKAYTTRVGWGAFKTEDTEERLDANGGRRPAADADVDGSVHLVVVKYSNSINYYTSLNLTKLDVLDTFETIKIAIAYKVNGQEVDSYPADLKILEQAEVVYHEMPGWQAPTINAKTYYDLPKRARDYVEYIEKFVGVKIKYIGTGPDREAMIQRA